MPFTQDTGVRVPVSELFADSVEYEYSALYSILFVLALDNFLGLAFVTITIVWVAPYRQRKGLLVVVSYLYIFHSEI